ncbi:MAG: hypothetical protein ACRDY1_09040, partial [Acidimicrobiales bacterium]
MPRADDRAHDVDPALDDHALAAEIAGRAGALLLELRRDGPGGRELGANGDRRAHELITAALHGARPDDAVLSEEGVQS